MGEELVMCREEGVGRSYVMCREEGWGGVM